MRAPSRRAAQTAVWMLASLPAFGLALRAATDGLGANPIEEISHVTGRWALRWLLLALAVTPARRWLGLTWLAPLRRSCGLAAFSWLCLHLTTWLALDQAFDPVAIAEDLRKRRFITAGLAGFLCLLPLAVTSTRGWMRRLGSRRWVALHRLAYAGAACAVVHHLWLVKADLRDPLIEAGVLALLLAARLPLRRNPGRAAPRVATPGRS